MTLIFPFLHTRFKHIKTELSVLPFTAYFQHFFPTLQVKPGNSNVRGSVGGCVWMSVRALHSKGSQLKSALYKWTFLVPEEVAEA